MRVSQTFRKNSSDSDSNLSIFLSDIKKETKLEDVLSEVKNIYSTYFPD